jgi:hypothetical protein
MDWLGPRWKDFSEISKWEMWLISVDVLKIGQNKEKIANTLHDETCIFKIILVITLQSRVIDKSINR